MLASVQKDASDRFLFNARNPFDASDTITLKQEPQNHQGLFFAQVHVTQKSFVHLLKASFASIALVSLVAFVVFPSFDSFDFAVMTRHEPCLSLATGSQLICLESGVSNRVRFSKWALSVSADEALLNLNVKYYLTEHTISDSIGFVPRIKKTVWLWQCGRCGYEWLPRDADAEPK